MDSQTSTPEEPKNEQPESGAGLRKASGAGRLGDASCKLYRVILAFLLIAALLASAVYSLAVAGIVCRIQDWKRQQRQQRQQQQQLTSKPTPHAVSVPANRTSISNSEDNTSSTDKGICSVQVSPFRQLLSASTVILIIFNSVAALVFLESLMLLPLVNACGRPPADRTRRCASTATGDVGKRANKNRISKTSRSAVRDSKAVRTTETANAFSDVGSLQQNTNDFVLKLMYKTRCRDHLIIKVRLPTANPSSRLGFHRTTRISPTPDETILPESERLSVPAQGVDRPDGESNFVAASGLKGASKSSASKIPEQKATLQGSPKVRWNLEEFNVDRVNETEIGGSELRSLRKSRGI